VCGLDVDFSMAAPDTDQPAALRKYELARARIQRGKKYTNQGVTKGDFHIYDLSTNIPPVE